MSEAFIQFDNIIKVYPPAHVALKEISFDIQEAEIHSIIGENGAGKSTLMKILYGMEKISEGAVLLRGSKLQLSSPREAVAAGIGMVHQEFMLIPGYTVLENVILGVEPCNRAGFLRKDVARKKLQSVMSKFQLDISLDEKIENLSIAAQQKIEIVKLLYRDVNVLILDEPTAVLAPQEVSEFFRWLFQLKQQGKTILFISHKLDEVLEISDRITVMRQGQRIWTKANKNLSKEDLANAMVGRDVIFSIKKKPVKRGEVVLAVDHVSVNNRNVKDKLVLDSVTFDVHSGEIVGIAGVEGNGQYELVQSLIGIQPVNEGKIKLNGHDITQELIHERRKLIAYVSQDRKTSGSSQKDSLIDNASMTHHYTSKRFSGLLGLMSKKKTKQFTEEIIEHFQVACTGAGAAISSLSGGNQQKIIVGREFELNRPFIMLDQPVRGLDVGSIEYIQKRIIEQRDSGAACLLVSADLDELFSLSDRILVFYKGKIVVEKRPEETSKQEIGEYMLGARG